MKENKLADISTDFFVQIINDEKSPPVGGLFCMVDVKELESLTTRTSSECSTS